MVRPRSTLVCTPKPPTIEADFEKPRNTSVNITNSYTLAQQVKSQKGRIGVRTLTRGKRGSHGNPVTFNAHYKLFESRRRPKSATSLPSRSNVQRPKSTGSRPRTVTPSARLPIPRISSVTLTPKTVTPRLTKCRDLNPRPKSETPRPVFSSFKPKTIKPKTEEESLPEFFKSRARSTPSNDRMTLSCTFNSSPSVLNQSTEGTSRQSPSPKPKSSRELFCNCGSAQPKLYPKYGTNLTAWDGHDATTKRYENLIHMWSTQGLHWINCAGGELCSRAVEGGHTRLGEPLYIARALTPDMTKSIGTFHPATGLCYVTWKGTEIATDDYELLCYRSRIQSPAVLYNYTPTTNILDTLKVLTLGNRQRTMY